MSGYILKNDNTVKRETERGMRDIPVDPLTKKEKKRLFKNCWEKCRNGYVIRMKAGLLSDYEEPSDLVGEAYLLMNNILDKFDKSKCGEIVPDGECDVPGRYNPKTLEFYFRNYFYGRVNFTAAESREYKKKRGQGPTAIVESLMYDENYEDNYVFNEYKHKYESTGDLLNELKGYSDDLAQFIMHSYVEGWSLKELKEGNAELNFKGWGSKFNKLRNELSQFKRVMRKKHGAKFLDEIKRDS